jgi:ATP-binding cassette, subfamily B (MDR/TAP), member 7
VERSESPESVKPELVQQKLPAETQAPAKPDDLLTTPTVSNKEQRKADWAIMKEMARYLWPKVASGIDPGVFHR